MAEINLQSILTCPFCGYQKVELMPTDSCQYFYECDSCGQVIKAKEEDCCVYCSYGTKACPPVQQNQGCC